MSALSPILDRNGRPYARPAPAAERFGALGRTFRGADPISQELGGWRPGLTSPAGEMWGERDPLVARVQDIARNNGYASGIKQTLVDSVIGANWRLRARPNWRVLGIDFKTSLEWASMVEAKWRSHAEDPGCWIDAARRQRHGGLLRSRFISWFLSGEHCAIAKWLPDRVGPGRARYATALQLIDSDRLSSPNGAPESPTLRQGVELGTHGEPLAYWFRDAHPADWANAMQAATWTRVPRETAWGRPLVLHGYEVERDGQVRGKPPMAAIVETLRLEDVYGRTEAVQQILNSMYAATLETEFGSMDPETFESIFGKDKDTGSLNMPSVEMTLRGVKVPDLPPGKRLKFNSLNRSGSNFAEFEKAMLRRVSAGAGLSYEQVSKDYSDSNYSSSRAAFAEAWKFMTGKSSFMAATAADHDYALWLEEAINIGDVELPPGSVDFYERKADWSACRWIGPGKGYVDEVKEVQASQMKINVGLSTLEEETASQGADWLENLEQLAYEQAEKERLGIKDDPKAVYQVNSGGGDQPPAKKKNEE